MNKVEVVIINWKRPDNVRRIVEAYKNQSEPCTVTVVDCHPAEEYALPPDAYEYIDRTIRLVENYGAFSRYVPVGAYDHEFTLFADDDMVPGTRCVESFLRHSYHDFGVLTQLGRRMRSDGVYEQYHVQPSDTVQPIDDAIRNFFVRTRNLGFVPMMKWKLGLAQRHDTEDDIILCTAMVCLAKLPVLLLPQQQQHGQVNAEELPVPHALSWRPDHIDRRTETFRRAIGLGWYPADVR